MGTVKKSKTEDATKEAYRLLVNHSTSDRKDLTLYELKKLLRRDDFGTIKLGIQREMAKKFRA